MVWSDYFSLPGLPSPVVVTETAFSRHTIVRYCNSRGSWCHRGVSGWRFLVQVRVLVAWRHAAAWGNCCHCALMCVWMLPVPCPGAGGSPVYLWYKHGGGLAPIVEFSVLYDDEPTPEGFVKIGKDLTKGVDSRVYLAFRRLAAGEEAVPIADIRILDSEEAPGAAVRLLALWAGTSAAACFGPPHALLLLLSSSLLTARPLSEGFEKVSRALNRSDVFLFYKRREGAGRSSRGTFA